MALRSAASVTITFGMITVEVKLYNCASPKKVSFNLINPETGNKLNQKLVDSVTNKEVDRKNTIKGFEYKKGSYVTFTENEINNLQSDKCDMLDIVEFIPVKKINTLHIEKTYYLNPNNGMDKQYQLLFQTLRNENRAAVGTWIVRGKENLVTILALKEGLIMHQMYYQNEVQFPIFTCKNIELSLNELAMSKALVDQYSVDSFNECNYTDRFLEKVNKAVEVKLAGPSIPKKEINTSMESSLYESLVAVGVPKKEISKLIAEAESKETSGKKSIHKSRAKKVANS